MTTLIGRNAPYLLALAGGLLGGIVLADPTSLATFGLFVLVMTLFGVHVAVRILPK